VTEHITRSIAVRGIDRLLRHRPGFSWWLVAGARLGRRQPRMVRALARRSIRWKDPRLAAASVQLAGELGDGTSDQRAIGDAIAAAILGQPGVDFSSLLRPELALPLTPELRSATAVLFHQRRWKELEALAACGSTDVLRRTALQAAEVGHYEVTTRLLERAPSAIASPLWTSFARRADARGDLEVAAAAARRGFAETPTVPSQAIEVWIRVQRALGDPAAVTRLITQMAARSTDPLTHLWAVQRLLTCRALDEAAELAAELPRDGAGPILEVRAYLLARRYHEAADALAELSRAREDAEVEALRAELAQRTSRPDEALDAYLRAIEDDPDHPSADTWRFAAAKLAISAGDARARALLDDLSARRPDDPRIAEGHARLAARRNILPEPAVLENQRAHHQAVLGAAEGGHLELLRNLLLVEPT
jgi:tetratricopeptide (TPR) repeat protein